MCMDNLFAKKYRIDSARLPRWDYRRNGWYFITVVTQFRQPYFVTIHHENMFLSWMGCVVRDEWMRLAWWQDIMLDEWVIMPDHMHGIICIHDQNPQTN